MAISFVRSASATGTRYAPTTIDIDIGSPGTDRLVVISAGGQYRTGIEGSVNLPTVDGKEATYLISECGGSPGDTYTGNPTAYITLWAIDEVGLGNSSGIVTVSIDHFATYPLHVAVYTGVRNKQPVHTESLTASFPAGDNMIRTVPTVPDNSLLVCNFHVAHENVALGGAWTAIHADITARHNADAFLTADAIVSSSKLVYAEATHFGYTLSFVQAKGVTSHVVFAQKPSSYTDPEIHNIGSEVFATTSKNVNITGGGFGATQGTTEVYLADGADYATANTQVQSTYGSWADGSIEFDVSIGSLTGHDIWVFVVKDPGGGSEVVSNGFKVWIGDQLTRWITPNDDFSGAYWVGVGVAPRTSKIKDTQPNQTNPYGVYYAQRTYPDDTGYLVFDDWRFADYVPPSAVLSGIELQIKNAKAGSGPNIYDKEFSFAIGPNVSGSKIGSDFSSAAIWGEAWYDYRYKEYGDVDTVLGGISTVQLRDAGLRVFLNADGVSTYHPKVDAIRARVQYEYPIGPAIDAINGYRSNPVIQYNDINVGLTGVNFGNTKVGNALVLADSSTYSTANKHVIPSGDISSWGLKSGSTMDWVEYEIVFNMSLGSLAAGNLYFFVVTDYTGGGEQVSPAFPVTVQYILSRYLDQLYKLQTVESRYLDQKYGVYITGLRILGQRYALAAIEHRYLDQLYALDTGVQYRTLDNHYAFFGGQMMLDLVDRVNAERAVFGLEPITRYIGPGEDIATAQSQNMAAVGIQEHDDPSFPVGYQTFGERLDRVQGAKYFASENLSRVSVYPYNETTLLNVDAVVDAWMASPIHRANILYDYDPGGDHPPMMMLGNDYTDDFDSQPDITDPYYSKVIADSPLAYYRCHDTISLGAKEELGLGVATYSDSSILGFRESGPLGGGQTTFGIRTNYEELVETTAAVISELNDITNDVGIECWFKPTNDTGPQRLWSYADHSVVDRAMGLSYVPANDTFNIYFRKDKQSYGTDLYSIQTNVLGLGASSWVHVYIDSGTDGQYPDIYVNGTQKTWNTSLTNGTPEGQWLSDMPTPDTLGFGRFFWLNADDESDVFLSEIAFYLTKLTPTQVLAHYNSTDYYNDVMGDSPYIYYRLHDTGLNILEDSINYQDGLILGTVLDRTVGPLTNQPTFGIDNNLTGSPDFSNILSDIYTTDSSVELWFKTDTTSANKINTILWITQENVTNRWLRLDHYYDPGLSIDCIRYLWRDAASYGTDFYRVHSEDLGLGLGTWHHFYADAGTDNINPTVYIDGTEIAWTDPHSQNLGTPGGKWIDDLPATIDICFAGAQYANSGATDDKYDMQFSEAAFYTSKLTSAQILEHYNTKDTASIPGQKFFTVTYTQVFIHFGYPDNAIMNRYISQRYSVTGALIEYMRQTYSLDAYTPVRNQHDTNYLLVMGMQNNTTWGTSIATQHVASMSYSFSTQNETLYSTMGDIRTQNDALYSLDEYASVVTQLSTNYSFALALSHDAAYSFLQTIANQNDAIYSFTSEVRNQNEAPYSNLTYQPVVTSNTAFWTLIDYTTDILVPSVTLTHNGATVDIAECTVSCSEGDMLWVANVVLTDLSIYLSLQRGDAFTVNIEGEIFDFVVQSKSLNRSSPGNVSIRLDGLSPATRYKSPDAALISPEYENSMTARSIVENLLGESVDWGILDWVLPENTITGSNTTPAALSKSIVESIGGLLESNKDGTLRARNTFPVTIPDYATAAVNQVYTDVADNLSVSETFEPRTDYNKFRITSGDASVSDSLEWKPNNDDPTRGVLRAYLVPWRGLVNVSYTGGGLTSISYRGTVSRSVTEVIEITNGEGGTQYPIFSINSIKWHSSSLGGLSYDTGTRNLTASTATHYGYGLAEITYTTKALEYNIEGSEGIQAQFISVDSGQ